MAQRVKAKPSKQATPASDEDRILNAFRGEFPSLKTPFHYRLGLFLVAIAMILLPLVYIGVIGLTGWGIYWYATHAGGIFENVRGRGAIVALIVYLGPLIAGGILILFMIKPLFAGRPKHAEPRALDPDSEPLLFEFVRRLCRTLGAPVPSEIRVDTEVNASASFRRGFISLFTGDLVLTIGLPLVVGLNLRELTGVLAHEFGHFAQRAGMRTTYVIRTVNGWFMRVVYERDAWDEQLVEWSKEMDIRIGIIFYIARLFVWLTRQILWLLMVIGHAISCFMLREMEYDADRHETWLAGSKAFEKTSRRVIELSVAHQLAQRDLGTFWNEGRLPDNLPGLIQHNTDLFKKEIGELVHKEIDESKTGWFDTHPCGADRIARARAEKAEGIFHLEEPSDVLFSTFKALCCAASRDHYREVLGRGFKPDSVKPLEELISRQQKERAGGEALFRFLQLRISPLRPLPLGATPSAPATPGAPHAQQLKALRDRMLAAVPAYRKDFKVYDDIDTRVLESHRATALIKARFKINARDFHLRQPTAECARQTRGQYGAKQHEIEPRLTGFEESAVARLRTALGFLHEPEVAAQFESSTELIEDANRILPAAQHLGGMLPGVTELRNAHVALASLLEQLEDNQNDESLINTIRSQMERVLRLLRRVQEALGDEPYPFDHAGGPITIRKQVLPRIPHQDDLGGIFEAAGEALEQITSLYVRCLGRLALIAEQVETALGLEPLPEPPEEETD